MDHIEWLVQVGFYIQACWLAEERVRTPGADLDETETWALWDKFKESELIQQRADAAKALENYRKQKQLQSLRENTADWIGTFRGIRWTTFSFLRGLASTDTLLGRGMKWHGLALWRGVVSAFGLLFAGWLLSRFWPLAARVFSDGAIAISQALSGT